MKESSKVVTGVRKATACCLGSFAGALMAAGSVAMLIRQTPGPSGMTVGPGSYRMGRAPIQLEIPILITLKCARSGLDIMDGFTSQR